MDVSTRAHLTCQSRSDHAYICTDIKDLTFTASNFLDQTVDEHGIAIGTYCMKNCGEIPRISGEIDAARQFPKEKWPVWINVPSNLSHSFGEGLPRGSSLPHALIVI